MDFDSINNQKQKTHAAVSTFSFAEVRTQLLKGFICFPDKLLKITVITDISIQDLQMSTSCTKRSIDSEYAECTLFLFDKRVNLLTGKRWTSVGFRIPKSNSLSILSGLSLLLILQLHSHGTCTFSNFFPESSSYC